MTIDNATFLHNLRLTQAYCARQLQAPVAAADPTVLRSLNPSFGDGQLFREVPNSYSPLTGNAPATIVEWEPEADRYDREWVAQLFAAQLEAKRPDSALAADDEPAGRILTLAYEENIPDGVVAAVEGFFDEQDFPPIDTWFYLAQHRTRGGILFAWIPATFVSLASTAIDMHYLDVLAWFDEWRSQDRVALSAI